MFTSYNFPKLENCIDKQLSQIGNISLVGDRALRAFLARAPRLADPGLHPSDVHNNNTTDLIITNL